MIAAKLRHKDLVSSVLRSNRFDGSDDIDFLAELIHSRNGSGQTLLAMVALQGNQSSMGHLRLLLGTRGIKNYSQIRKLDEHFNLR